MNKTYVMADIHGQFEKFEKMLKKINFTASDKLYILGDIIDRGSGSIEIIKYIRKKKNIVFIKGNHESMMLESFELRKQYEQLQDESLLNEALLTYIDWLRNGGSETLELFNAETKHMQSEIVKFLEQSAEYAIVEVEGKTYALLHAGLIIPKPDIDLETIIDANMKIKDLHLYVREEFWNSKYYTEGVTYVVGHTPTKYLPNLVTNMGKNNLKRCTDNKIYKDKYKICIDCGCYSPGGRLACLRLDDLKEYYT